MKPLHVKQPILAGVVIGLAGASGYLGSASPTLAGAVAIMVAALIPTVLLAVLAIGTNRRIRGSGLDSRPTGPLWGPPGPTRGGPA